MTAKEKAKELLHKMFNTGSALYADRIGAKQCALIVVDEIMLTQVDDPWSDEDYWLEVKKELEKL